jgi:hypothetical protein
MSNAALAPVARWSSMGTHFYGWSRRRVWALAGFLVVALGVAAAGSLRAQDEHRHKVPGLDKITSPGPGQQEFNGKVQSVDLHGAVLNVQSLRENNVEIFPIKKGVRVTTANGEKLSLDKLEPGTNVLVYYEQKGDRRSVKGIIVLSAAPAEPKNGEPKQAKSGSPS